ncbi:hypothetical protein ATI14_3773 [Pseudomonas tolaasii NCPPB 2192]|uniref:Uncharacterized protein n=1 Tax=Pseudomonas tolaasii NCPPB 2192 TaxID=564423 RepID=A0ABX4QIZ9_PSETO|nr:hypothetical protein ATI14_3773 [Pseudomonas tolaasii NCPPB 2192]
MGTHQTQLALNSLRGVAKVSAPKAFDDPNTAPDAPPTRGIELQTWVFYAG